MSNKQILVLGGTGFIGRHLCEQLIRAGHRVTVPTRKLENAREIQMLPGLLPIACDVHDAQQLSQAAAGHDVLINLVAILHGSAAEFERVHVKLVHTIVQACKAAGIKRVIHMSSLGAAEDAPSQYSRSKWRGDQVLLQSGLDVTLLRPSVVFGAGDRFLNMFASLQRVFPIMPLACADAQFQPVWVQDVAQAVLAVLAQDKSNAHPVYELVGEQIFTLRQIVQLAGLCAGVSRPVIGLPAALAQLQATMMEFMPGPTLLSRDNLASMQRPNIASGKLPGLRELGIEPASLAAIAPTYLRPHSKLNTLRQSASR